MRNSTKAAYLRIAVLLMATGCGDSGTDSDAPTVETINFNDEADADAEENNSDNLGIMGNVEKRDVPVSSELSVIDASKGTFAGD